MIRRFRWCAFLLLTLQCFYGAEPSINPQDLSRRPPTPPAQALETFRVKPGFSLELVAAEPLVVDPIALSFNEQGQLFVLEMRDYSERRPERLGRVRMLIDTNADGFFDQATIFVDDLPWPTALCYYDGGVFVGATPDLLYCKDTNQDGVADSRQVVFTGFASEFAPYQTNQLNVQALLNNLTWTLDNRIQGSTSHSGGRVTCPLHPDTPAVNLRGCDFSFDPRAYDLRPESGGGQHGLAFDNSGRKFICSNSSHCRWVTYEARYAQDNQLNPLPAPSINIATDGDAAPVYRISPEEPWRVIRTRWRVAGLVPGPIEGGGKPSGYFTGATGITVYRGNAFPEAYVGDVFVADCGSNLIHHKHVREDGAILIAERPKQEDQVEFLASTDNWFRPVQLANGPEGALYVADMYREVIEHPWSLPDSIKQHLDLNSGNDRGRIYRIVPADFKQPPARGVGGLDTAGLVRALARPNGWDRDTAARLLYERQERSAIPDLARLLKSSESSLGRLHALYALKGLNALQPDQIRQAFHDPDPTIRLHALRLSEGAYLREITLLTGDPSPRVRYQLAFTLGLLGPTNLVSALKAIALASVDDTSIRMAAIHAAGGRSLELLLALASDSSSNVHASAWFADLAATVGAQDDATLRLLDRLREPDLSRALPEIVAGLGEGLKRRGSSLAKFDTRHTLDELFARAMRAAIDTSAPLPERSRAVQLLAFAQSAPALQTLGQLLQEPGPLSLETLKALKSFQDPKVAPLILGVWARLTPDARAQALDTLLVRVERVGALLIALSEGHLRPTDLDPRQQQFLRNYPDPSLRARAQGLLASAQPGQRDEVIKEFQPALQQEGSASRGHKIFLERCASCHRLGGEGHALGPDLAPARSSGWEKLLGQILDPNREVAPNHVGYTVETRDGEIHTGIIAQEDPTHLTLRQANGLETRLARSNIASLHSEGLSLMPIGLEAGLSHQDMAGLLQFLAPR